MPTWLENPIQKFAEKNVIHYVIMHKSSIPGFQLHTHVLVFCHFSPGHLDSVSKELWISVFNSSDCCKIISVDSVSKELWISVFNSTDCCKNISVTNDIH